MIGSSPITQKIPFLQKKRAIFAQVFTEPFQIFIITEMSDTLFDPNQETAPLKTNPSSSAKILQLQQYVPCLLQHLGTLLAAIVFYEVLNFPQSSQLHLQVSISDKVLLLLYLVIECSQHLIEYLPRTGFIFFSFLLNLITVAVVGTYPLSTVLISFSIFFAYLVCLGVLGDQLPDDWTPLSTYFVVFCLGLCTLSMLVCWGFWSYSLPRLLCLVVGSALFSCFIISNFQVMLGRGKHQEGQTQELTVLRTLAGLTYLFWTELAALSI